MLISQQDDLVISAQHLQLADQFIIEIESPKVQHLISEFNNDYILMANHLKIHNKRMVLLNPVSHFHPLTLSIEIFEQTTRRNVARRSPAGRAPSRIS
jgi:hypothetical protein